MSFWGCVARPQQRRVCKASVLMVTEQKPHHELEGMTHRAEAGVCLAHVMGSLQKNDAS